MKQWAAVNRRAKLKKRHNRQNEPSEPGEDQNGQGSGADALAPQTKERRSQAEPSGGEGLKKEKEQKDTAVWMCDEECQTSQGHRTSAKEV